MLKKVKYIWFDAIEHEFTSSVCEKIKYFSRRRHKEKALQITRCNGIHFPTMPIKSYFRHIVKKPHLPLELLEFSHLVYLLAKNVDPQEVTSPSIFCRPHPKLRRVSLSIRHCTMAQAIKLRKLKFAKSV